MDEEQYVGTPENVNAAAVISRRTLLALGPVVPAALAGCSSGKEGQDRAPSSAEVAPRTGEGSLRVFCAALHVHSCFSEGTGSMQAQLDAANRLGVDVVWWTDHDWRMQAVQYWTDVPFEGPVQTRQGLEWRWEVAENGAQTSGRHEFGPGPPRPGEAADTNILFVSQQNAGGNTADPYRLVALADSETYRTSLHGQVFKVDIYPERASLTSFLAFDLVTSRRPSVAGRPAATYRLSYRVGGPEEVGSRVVREGVGVVTLVAPQQEWTRLSFEPAHDLSLLWPELDGRDAAPLELTVSAWAGGTAGASGYFGSLRIERSAVSGDEPLRTQASLMDHYRSEYPDITQFPGIEVSLGKPHLGAYGGVLTIPIEPKDAAIGDAPDAQLVADLQRAGTLVCYNHPFGSSHGEVVATEQPELVQKAAAMLVQDQALGCQLLEVGYRSRGGSDLLGHQRVWDACSRAGIFLTGLGTNDNHSGTGWDSSENNFVTWIWAVDPTESDLLDSLASGYAYFGDPTLFAGTLDLLTAQGARMGQVVVAHDHGSVLSLVATDLPKGSSVELIRLCMDDSSTPGRQAAPHEQDYRRVVLPATDFADGTLKVPLEAGISALYRTVVVDALGRTIALSNPIWLLVAEPGTGIPASRRT